MRIGVIEIPRSTLTLRRSSRVRRFPQHHSRRATPYRATTRGEHPGLIIDLRSNSGGSLQEADSMTGLFIGAGPTVQVKA